MRKGYAFIWLLAVLSCNPEKEINYPFGLNYSGALKSFMKQGDISAKADLDSLRHYKHLYALGALEDLKGEIQIFNSQPFNSYVKSDTVAIDTTFDHKASIMVYAFVKEWKSFPIPDHILTMQMLEAFIEKAADEFNINTNLPFPFLINGRPASLAWHVIDWPSNDQVHTHEKHINSGINGQLSGRSVELLGFFSKKHKGIFTHHTSNIHIHFKTTDNLLAGHVDDLIPGKNVNLLLPITEEQ